MHCPELKVKGGPNWASNLSDRNYLSAKLWIGESGAGAQQELFIFSVQPRRPAPSPSLHLRPRPPAARPQPVPAAPSRPPLASTGGCRTVHLLRSTAQARFVLPASTSAPGPRPRRAPLTPSLHPALYPGRRRKEEDDDDSEEEVAVTLPPRTKHIFPLLEPNSTLQGCPLGERERCN